MSRDVPIKLSVIGAGSWGTTVASLACLNTPTVLWARRSELAEEINQQHTNVAYLPGVDLPASLRATASMAEAAGWADVLVMGVPSHGFRAVLAEAAPHVRPWVPVVSLAKGLEGGTRQRMSEVIAEVLPGHPVAVLTGPNLAAEIIGGQPAASVVATGDDTIAAELQRIFSGPALRVYTNADLIGSEISGVVKNVIAICAGIADGLGFGDNTRATVITRGLAEMARLGVALGGNPLTFSGLAGMGDLIATCSSSLSRNHMVGVALGRGRTIEEITSEMKMVAEGVKSCPSVLDLATEQGVMMPITEAIVAVCHRGLDAREAMSTLMSRDVRAELHGLTP